MHFENIIYDLMKRGVTPTEFLCLFFCDDTKGTVLDGIHQLRQCHTSQGMYSS